MPSLPTLFLSHGSPMHALQAGRAGAGWVQLAGQIGKPRAVLIASAHWESEWPMLTTSSRPDTIHDFGGFPDELYKLRYPAPGAPEVAQRAVDLLKAGGMSASANGCRGLDHGAWVPLRHMYPEADVPVVQLSLQTQLPATHALRVGRLLAPLAGEGVLMIGSGHMTHNLREWIEVARRHRMRVTEAATAPYVEEFRAWVDAALRGDDAERIARWADEAPHAQRAHPSDEHFLPLPFAFGAAGARPTVERIDLGVDSGVLAMDAYVFTPRA
ncbi:MAG: DODA-type extradiol aromatic ring-opening family dioxygenase [Gemmatimonadota bacterium]